jgi:hypothetical protein
MLGKNIIKLRSSYEQIHQKGKIKLSIFTTYAQMLLETKKHAHTRFHISDSSI